MASSTRPCSSNKCEISSCAVCHCCQTDLCIDHLKEHRDRLNTDLLPLADKVNELSDCLENFNSMASPIFQQLEQWCSAAHETVDRFYEHLRDTLLEQKKNNPLKRVQATREALDLLIRKQGATRENIRALTDDIHSIEQEILILQSTRIDLRPLDIDIETIVPLNVLNQQQQQKDNLNRRAEVASATNNSRKEDYFQIFVQLHSGETIFVKVQSREPIKEIKRRIFERTGIPVKQQQRLTYLGKALQDDLPASTYDIQRQCTLNLIFNPMTQN